MRISDWSSDVCSSDLKRALRSLEKQEMERFVTLSALNASLSNAQATLLAFETAAKTVSGSQIFLYERGFGPLKERILRTQSTYRSDERRGGKECVSTGRYRWPT